MFCSTCGSPLVAGAAHCGSCGSMTQQPVNPVNTNYAGPQTGYGAPPPYQYPQPGPYTGQPYYGAPASGRAVASLVLSLLGISIIGLILGYSARTEIRNSQGRVSGDGMALAGIIIGWIGTIGWILIWIGVLAAASMTPSYYW